MIRAVEKGILAKLSAASAITTLVSTRLYATQPPVNAALPYVLVAVSGGGSPNETPRDELDLMVTVKCVAQDTTSASGAATAKQMADAIKTALHEVDLALDSPWEAYRCQHEGAFVYSENVDRVQYTHAGGTYRVRATG